MRLAPTPCRLAERAAVAPPDGLEVLRAEVRELRVRLDRFEAWQQTVVAHALAVSSRLDTPDASARLLSAIARAYGGRVFTAADLSSSMDEELRAVLVGKDGRRVGAWLRRLHVCPVPPYTLRRVGRDGPGVLWTVTIESR